MINQRTIHATVVGANDSIAAPHDRFSVNTRNGLDANRQQAGTFGLGGAEKVTIEAPPLLDSDVARTAAAMNRADTSFAERRVDPDGADIHVQDVRVNAPLHHTVRQADPFGRQVLDQRLRDDAAAHVAALRPWLVKRSRLVDIDTNPQVDAGRHVEYEIRE